MAGERYVTAQAAAAELGISMATLYAYTSRGQLRSEPVPDRPRERRYYREDIERLRERKEARRDPAKAAARGLHWGSPVLDSAITLIDSGKLYYRGLDALMLTQGVSLEAVAELLWAAEPIQQGRSLEQPCALSAARIARLRACAKGAPLSLLQAALPVAAASDPASYDLRPAAVRQTGARILRLFTTLVTGRDSPPPMHRALQAAWAPRKPMAAEVIRAALVLCADHELNVSAFVARCAASAGASPYDVVSAAMATLKGQRHGGATERAGLLFQEAGTPGRARAAMASLLRRGESVPGFGHPLYSSGDPRAALLLKLAEASGNREESRLIRQLARAGAELLQEQPNLDFGLAAISRAYGLPEHAPLLLFALGRTVGWIAHAIEQYATGELIRPRARYTGPLPAAG